MMRRLAEIESRRAALIAEADAHRTAIAQVYRRWQSPARLLDRGLAAVSFLKSRPVVIALAVAGLLAARRAGWPKAAGRFALLWRTYRGYQALRARFHG